jgi:hypothetical protein
MLRSIQFLFALSILFIACTKKSEGPKDEQIKIQKQSAMAPADSLLNNTINGNLAFDKISSAPNQVVLTGLPQHRLITIYRTPKNKKDNAGYYSFKRRYDDDSDERSMVEHYMPGIDLIYGYNMVNVAHYDLSKEKMNLLFDHPVLIKSLYYPSYVQDSLFKKPINRNFYLVSVYDADTNADTLIDRSDLRRLYLFTAEGDKRLQVIPSAYSVKRSQYDPMNDVVYVFANHDANANGEIEKEEPLHIFWFSLKQPAEAKRMY